MTDSSDARDTSNNEEFAANEKALLRKAMKALHPDRFVDRTIFPHDEKNTQTLAKLITDLINSDQVRSWPPPHNPQEEVLFVGITTGGEYRVAPGNEKVRLGKDPVAFLRAYELFVHGKDWSEVKQRLTARGSSPDAQIVSALQLEVAGVTNFGQAGTLAVKIDNTLSNTTSRLQAMRVLHRRVEQLIEDKTKTCKELDELEPLRAELRVFSNTPGGRLFLESVFLDFLDAAALRIGRQMIADTRSPDELKTVLEKIHAFPFQYAEAYTAPFAESQEDALSKFDFFDKLRRTRSLAGLDKLREDVSKFTFKTTQYADVYRNQIYGFIERKKSILEFKASRGEEGIEQGIDN